MRQQRLTRADALALLGFEPGAAPSQDEVVAAYRRAALRHHPDRDGSDGATARFQAVQQARDFLVSEETVEGFAQEEGGGPRLCPRCAQPAVPPPEQPWVFRCRCGAVLRNPDADGDVTKPVTVHDIALEPGSQGELRRFTGRVPARGADAVVWRCKECPEQASVCCRPQQRSRCVCGHLKRSHGGVGGPCSGAGCACAQFRLHPCVGAWQARCQCKHTPKDHDPRSGKCGKNRCGCSGVLWAWVCNCGHSGNSHEMVPVAGAWQAQVTREWVAGALRAETVAMAAERRDRWAKAGSAPPGASVEAQARVAAVAGVPRRAGSRSSAPLLPP